MEIIQTIALLCQLKSGADSVWLIEKIQKDQLLCHQYYVNCLDPLNTNYKSLAKCVSERKL